MRAVVGVIGKDMVGILAKVSAECKDANVSVIEVSQTLLQDMFTMITPINITERNTTLADLAAHMENVGKQSGLTVHVMHEGIFGSIHKIWDGERMINVHSVLEITEMIGKGYLGVRIITIGISLLDCCDSDIDKSCEKIYDKITRLAKNLVRTGEDTERGYSIPVISKRISVTPITMLVTVGGGGPVKCVHALERYTQAVGINFIGGYSASVQKGCAVGDRELMESIPKVSMETEHVCASINVGSTKAGISVNAVELIGRMVKEAVGLTRDRNYIGAAELVVFCNAPGDNPFMADTFHGVGEADCVISIGVSNPGVVRAALAKADESLPMNELADIIKKTAFGITHMEQLVGTLASGRLGVPFDIVGLSLTPTPAVGDSVAYILEEMGLKNCGVHGMTACLAMLSDAVKKGGVMAGSTVDGLSGAFIPVSENVEMIMATRAGTLYLEKLEAMTAVCSVDLDMVVIPGKTTPEVISDIIADGAAIGIVNSKTTAARAIPVIDKKVGEELEFGGLLGNGPVMDINQTDCSVMIHRKGRIPAPIQALKS